ncbi:MAG TPA: hypothetical protein VGQ13_08025 [Nitrososphaera sp.]|jgi:hypothetical protein|nr:hypothetical protein [Nitrososphaera sp.]
MAIRREQPDKNSYWQNELRSLGIEPKRPNELNDKLELESLADNLKQGYYQDYKAAYSYEELDQSDFDYLI